MMVPVQHPGFLQDPLSKRICFVSIGWKAIDTGIFGVSPMRAFVHKACAARGLKIAFPRVLWGCFAASQRTNPQALESD